MVNSQPAKALPATKPIVFFSGCIVALMIGVSTWIYIESARTLRAEGATPESSAVLLHQMQSLALKGTIATVAGGVAFMVVLRVGFGSLRRGWVRRIGKTEQEKEETIRQREALNLELQARLVERTKLEEELRKAQTEVERGVEERTANL